MQVSSVLAEWLLSISTAVHTVGLLVFLVWTDSLVPRTESKDSILFIMQSRIFGVGVS